MNLEDTLLCSNPMSLNSGVTLDKLFNLFISQLFFYKLGMTITPTSKGGGED